MRNALLDTTPGDIVPPFVRETGLENWNRYAAVNDEFVDIHMDDDAGRAAGYKSAFGMGNLLWSYMHSMLRRWLDGNGEIVAVKCQFRAPNTKGMTITVSGIVIDVSDNSEGRFVTVEVKVEDQHGTILAPGEAVVRLFP